MLLADIACACVVTGSRPTNGLEVKLLEGEHCQQPLKIQAYRDIIWRLAHVSPLRKLGGNLK